jgi:preprotein translocase subunit
MREHQSQIDALLPGARVILNSGIFATISHIADTQAIVELAPGVEVTILKQAIARVTKNDEEEFEFTDEAEETPEGEESEESVDGVDAPEPEDTSATEEPVSEKN